jgi:hypothetical protein
MGGCRTLENITPERGGCPAVVGTCGDAIGEPGVEGVDCGTDMGVFRNGFRPAAAPLATGGFM